MSTNSVKPWARGPLELLQHAEEHRLGRRDFDRRVALIGFDNAVESSVITYLSLKPLQRGGRTFTKVEVERWLANFHSKVEFLEEFANSSQKAMPVGRPEIIYYHSLRNDLYHNGNGVVPATEHIDGARQAALWTFSVLFECDAEALLEQNGIREQRGADVAQLSAATAFLDSFIKIKNELSELLAAKNIPANGGGGLDRLLELLPEDINLPASIVDATLEAEKTKELVVQGDEDKIGEATLRTLTGELSTISEYLRKNLRSYQQEIVELAVSSTLASAQSDGRAGVVSQVTGSGLTMTLLAYLAKCKETSELTGLPYIVLVNRVSVGRGLVERMQHFSGHSGLTTAVMPNSSFDLERVLDTPSAQPIVTTWQMLRTLDKKQGFGFSCLVVYFDLGNGGFPNFDLKSMFPRGNFISFESASDQNDVRKIEIFGSLIRTYDYRTAVRDGYMLPVRIEGHSIATDRSHGEDVGEGRGGVEGLGAAQTCSIASALLNDFRIKMQSGMRQAVLVTNSRSSVVAFAQELKRLADEDTRSTGGSALIVLALANDTDLYRLYNDRESLIVWVSTIGLLAEVDLGPSVACYMATKVSQSAQRRLISLVARPRINASEAVIVDYAGNQWDSVLTGHL